MHACVLENLHIKRSFLVSPQARLMSFLLPTKDTNNPKHSSLHEIVPREKLVSLTVLLKMSSVICLL